MTFRERIAEIVRDCLITGYEGSVNELVEKNTDAILAAVREVVPVEKHSKFKDALSERHEMRCVGWNQCRESMLRALNSQEGV